MPWVSIHRFEGCSGGSDWASGFEALVVAVSFEIHLLPSLLGAVTRAVDSWVSTCTTIIDSGH